MKKYLILFLLLTSCGGSGGSSDTYTLSTEISGLAFPVRLEELPSGKLLIAELANGKLSIYDRQKMSSKTLSTFPIALEKGIGISGLLVDKDFKSNGFVFVYRGNSTKNEITRLTLADESVVKEETLNTFGKVSGHNGGGMIQFENGDILLGTGDAAAPDSAQDRTSLNGKLILLNRDGQIINANYSTGLRNPFGLSRAKNKIVVLDNGPDCDDKIYLVTENANFSWRANYVCGESKQQFTNPIYSWKKSEGVTDILYSQNSIFSGKLLVARYNTKNLYVLDFDGDTAHLETELFNTTKQGPIIDILETHNGEILLASEDGNIYRIDN